MFLLSPTDSKEKVFSLCRYSSIMSLYCVQAHPECKLQEAALFVVGNLVWRGEGGAGARQARLADLGVVRALRHLQRHHALHDRYVPQSHTQSVSQSL